MGIAGDSHLACAHRPTAPILLVEAKLGQLEGREALGTHLTTSHSNLLEVLSVVGIGIGSPVLRIDEVGTFEGLHLVVFDGSALGETRVKLIAMGMRHHNLVASSHGELCKRVGHSLRQTTGMGRPGHDDLRTSLLLVLLNSDDVGKRLERMTGGTFHREDGLAGILDELREDHLLVVVLLRLETGKRTHADDVGIAAHHGDGFEQMLGLVAVHHDTALCLEFPGARIHIEHDGVHAEVLRSLLGGETGAKRVVEEDQQAGLVPAQVLKVVAVSLYVQGFTQSDLEVPQVAYILVISHKRLLLFVFLDDD